MMPNGPEFPDTLMVLCGMIFSLFVALVLWIFAISQQTQGKWITRLRNLEEHTDGNVNLTQPQKVEKSLRVLYLKKPLKSFYPEFFNRIGARTTRREIEELAPDVIDLLMLSVEAGMTFENALLQTRDSLSLYSENLKLELRLLETELAILPNRSDAFSNLVQRTGSGTFRYLSVAMAQGEKYGTPVSASLKAVALESRKRALIQLERKANQLPVLMSIPLMFFILPPVIAISAGPGFIALMRSIGGSG